MYNKFLANKLWHCTCSQNRQSIKLQKHENIFSMKKLMFFSSPEPKAPGELIGWEGSVVRRPSVRPSVRPSSVHNFKRLLL